MASFNRPINYLLFLSSYVPLYILIAVRIRDTPRVSTLALGFVRVPITYTNVLIFSSVVLTIIFVWAIIRIRKRGTVLKQVTRVQMSNERLASYLVVYVFVFAGLSFTSTEDIIIFCTFFALLFFIEIRSELLYTNPLLAIWGYRLFEVTLQDRIVLVLSQEPLRENLIQKEDNGEEYTELELVPMGGLMYIVPKHE